MADIVERLRTSCFEKGLDETWIDAERKEAAGEIERLRAALLKIRDLDWPADQAYIMRNTAMEALGDE